MRSEHETQYHLYELKCINTKHIQKMVHVKVMNMAAYKQR